jgi:hypothetical protein
MKIHKHDDVAHYEDYFVSMDQLQRDLRNESRIMQDVDSLFEADFYHEFCFFGNEFTSKLNRVDALKIQQEISEKKPHWEVELIVPQDVVYMKITRHKKDEQLNP